MDQGSYSHSAPASTDLYPAPDAYSVADADRELDYAHLALADPYVVGKGPHTYHHAHFHAQAHGIAYPIRGRGRQSGQRASSIEDAALSAGGGLLLTFDQHEGAEGAGRGPRGCDVDNKIKPIEE